MDHGVPHQGRRRTEIAADGEEVEGAERPHKAFQRAVLRPVPGARRILGWLGRIDVLSELRIKTPEINQFGGSINFCLPDILSCAYQKRNKRIEEKMKTKSKSSDENRKGRGRICVLKRASFPKYIAVR